MAVTTGPITIQNPTPQVLRYGLFAVANGPLDMPPHAAQGGIQYLNATCGEWFGYEPNCLPDLQEKGPFTDNIGVTEATPFIVQAGFECSAVGLSRQERDRLTFEKLVAVEQGAVERIFSEGTFGASPSLSNNTTAATDVGASFGMVDAVSSLENAFYNSDTGGYGFQGVLHLPFAAGAYAQNDNVIYRDGRIWRTALGTAVSIGNYAGEGPAGQSPPGGSAWIYITPQVTIWRASEPFITPLEGALNRATNEVVMFSEREYVVSFDNCPIFASQTLLTEGS